MDMNVLREIVTVASFAAFIAILGYVVYPGNRRHFDEAARLPFEEDPPSPQPSPKGEGAKVGEGFANWERN